jgi:hypothetical protein
MRLSRFDPTIAEPDVLLEDQCMACDLNSLQGKPLYGLRRLETNQGLKEAHGMAWHWHNSNKGLVNRRLTQVSLARNQKHLNLR